MNRRGFLHLFAAAPAAAALPSVGIGITPTKILQTPVVIPSVFTDCQYVSSPLSLQFTSVMMEGVMRFAAKTPKVDV